MTGSDIPAQGGIRLTEGPVHLRRRGIVRPLMHLPRHWGPHHGGEVALQAPYPVPDDVHQQADLCPQLLVPYKPKLGCLVFQHLLDLSDACSYMNISQKAGSAAKRQSRERINCMQAVRIKERIGSG